MSFSSRYRGSRQAALALLVLGCCGGDTVRIERAGELITEFDVDIATTAEERAVGLRGRDSLCSRCGLWIEFPRATEACIENNGVAFAIDVLFVGDDQSVRSIERAVAADDATSRCVPDVRHVLEVNAGAASGLQPGDHARR